MTALAAVLELVAAEMEDYATRFSLRKTEPRLRAWAKTIRAATHGPAMLAMERDAARYQELCRQIDEGIFPRAILDDAEAMGTGALELHLDTALSALGKVGS